ncbi:hypothetical protein Q9966_000923 [Columba livia]|nr:hypothetical protein Q9966_000923 [Columba livia]
MGKRGSGDYLKYGKYVFCQSFILCAHLPMYNGYSDMSGLHQDNTQTTMLLSGVELSHAAHCSWMCSPSERERTPKGRWQPGVAPVLKLDREIKAWKALQSTGVCSSKANVPNPKGLPRVDRRLQENPISSELNYFENRDLLSYLGNDLRIIRIQEFRKENDPWCRTLTVVGHPRDNSLPGSKASEKKPNSIKMYHQINRHMLNRASNHLDPASAAPGNAHSTEHYLRKSDAISSSTNCSLTSAQALG